MSLKSIGILSSLALFLSIPLTFAHSQAAGIFEGQSDVGSVTPAGTASFDQATGVYTIHSAGANLWGTTDGFHFLWKKVSGDVSLTADIDFPEKTGQHNEHRKAILIFRQTLDADGAYVDAAQHGVGLTALQFRDAKGATTQSIELNIDPPQRVRIEKHGDEFTMFVSFKGEPLHQVGAATKMHLDGPFYAGIGLSAHDPNGVETATFAHVELKPLVASSVAPQMALYSSLKAAGIDPGARRAIVAYTAKARAAAPNWSRDGKWLIFNQEGKMFRVAADGLGAGGDRAEQIDTGNATGCNGSHGLSPDGKLLAITCTMASNPGNRVYIIPTIGGMPRMVTANPDSYFHTWSPDGKTIVFTRPSHGGGNIYAISVDGGTETALTTGSGISDDPDYSPDGQFIYFNTDRWGGMQIARMNADGSGVEQVTHDNFRNWTPHPSPDGKSIVYIAYPPDVTTHAANKDVALHILSTSDGSIRALTNLVGGDGSMNVPNWSPDSKSLAYVSYEFLPAEDVTQPVASNSSTVIRTSGGMVSGVLSADGSVLSYKGIPYAQPPVGTLRWRAPQPIAPWNGVLNADHFGASCMQRPNSELLPWTKEFMYVTPASEDCLFLNVWTPKVGASAKLPVLVFIHGGAFTSGSGDVPVYDGEALAKSGIVVVTINYRVGVFGFLAHPDLTAESDHHSSGNYGLLDQIAALRWVKQNIAAFGGDPAHVAVAGQSAGAMSVEDLLASPLASHLFSAAIADSGIGGRGLPSMTLTEAEKAGQTFASAMGADSIAALRAMPARQLLQGQRPMGMFSPVIDGWVLPDFPIKLTAERGHDNDVPVITGFQEGDSRMGGGSVSAEDFKKHAQQIYGPLAIEFLRRYPAATDAEARQSQAASGHDRLRVGLYLWAARRAETHTSPVYAYYFDRAIPWPAHPEFGAFHSGELPYAFGNLSKLDRPWEPIDYRVSTIMMSYWIHMAASGNPNGSGSLKGKSAPYWAPVDPSKPAVMRLGAVCESIAPADAERFDFWKRYFESPQSEHASPF